MYSTLAALERHKFITKAIKSIIAKNLHYAYNYACETSKAFPEGEKIIATNWDCAIAYCNWILKLHLSTKEVKQWIEEHK